MKSVLIVQPGGRVEYINDLGREWFGLRADEPSDLERLIRRARPGGRSVESLCPSGAKKTLHWGASGGGLLLSSAGTISPYADHHACCGTFNGPE